MTYIGIDPGASGGLAINYADGTLEVEKMPETPHDLAAIVKEVRDIDPDAFAMLERVSAMPKQGVSSTFKFGANFGLIQGVLAAVGVRYELVTPGVWQKAMGCLSKGDKNVTKAAAQRMFPRVKVTHAVADALLLCEYARRIDLARIGKSA